MGAKNTLLTHFSSRYPRVTPRTEAKAPSTLALAVDGARMRIGDMWKMPLYAPAMKQAISSGAAEDEDVSVQMMSW
jgi:ribonuclease Z